MKKLWGGRFRGELDAEAKKFSYSLAVDHELMSADILVSEAHVTMLRRVGLLTKNEAGRILNALKKIPAEFKKNTVERLAGRHEDVHSLIQSLLERKIGAALAGKLHTGRSRNDLVATSTKIYIRETAVRTIAAFRRFQSALVSRAEKFRDVLIPGHTHLQRAQIVTAAHYFLAYVEMVERDKTRMTDAVDRMNECPLGSGALAGIGLPLDRDFVSRKLGFRKPAANSLDAVSDRDFIVEIISAVAVALMHLSRLAEDLIIWNSQEFGIVELDDRFSTGSSLMPHKKNPDMLELVRGRTGRAYGALISVLVTLKGLPLAYNRDMQEDKKPLFEALALINDSLDVLAGVVGTLEFNRKRCREASHDSFLFATDLLEYLVLKGVPFRDAHEKVGKAVRYATEHQMALNELPLAVYKKLSKSFEPDLFDLFDPRASVERKMTRGSTRPALVKTQINAWKKRLSALSRAK